MSSPQKFYINTVPALLILLRKILKNELPEYHIINYIKKMLINLKIWMLKMELKVQI